MTISTSCQSGFALYNSSLSQQPARSNLKRVLFSSNLEDKIELESESDKINFNESNSSSSRIFTDKAMVSEDPEEFNKSPETSSIKSTSSSVKLRRISTNLLSKITQIGKNKNIVGSKESQEIQQNQTQKVAPSKSFTMSTLFQTKKAQESVEKQEEKVIKNLEETQGDIKQPDRTFSLPVTQNEHKKVERLSLMDFYTAVKKPDMTEEQREAMLRDGNALRELF